MRILVVDLAMVNNKTTYIHIVRTVGDRFIESVRYSLGVGDIFVTSEQIVQVCEIEEPDVVQIDNAGAGREVIEGIHRLATARGLDLCIEETRTTRYDLRQARKIPLDPRA